ncbi:uncharacterized protein LOC141651499 [Silene latifolia]|uniref:uncharacterized protein LOC141651499 n=1 Tax=Silene latifolia TaxID=37657 RepID=UPI003D77D583
MCDGWSISTNTSCHPGGRIWVLWKPNIYQVHFLHYSAQAIHMRITEISTDFQFHCTMVYAFNDTIDRKDFWSDVSIYSDNITGPWLLCGDFNCVLTPTERLGGQTTIEEMEDFQACVDQCSLLDSPSTGSFYTWNNKQDPATRVYSRLDRVLVNQEWLLARPDAYANFFNEGYFDHSPCIIHDAATSFTGRKSFKFFNMWSKVPEFLPCVQQVWNKNWQGTKMFQVVMKLKSLKQPLKNLNKLLFADIENSTAHAWKVLDAIQTALHNNPSDSALIDQEREALKTYGELQTACDSFLLQKSKATWVNQGDNNTKYFLSVLKNRHVHSKIFKIADVERHIHTDGDKIQQAFLNYYLQLLGTTSTTTPVSVPVVQLGKINHPFITLLPKVELPQNVTQYRPIACCNVLYKAISKVPATRLSKVLPEIISPNQGAFVKGRTIIENILICQDLVRLYNRKSVSSRCMMKVDLKKAYDSVNWGFLEQMLEAL